MGQTAGNKPEKDKSEINPLCVGSEVPEDTWEQTGTWGCRGTPHGLYYWGPLHPVHRDLTAKAAVGVKEATLYTAVFQQLWSQFFTLLNFTNSVSWGKGKSCVTTCAGWKVYEHHCVWWPKLGMAWRLPLLGFGRQQLLRTPDNYLSCGTAG